MPRRELVVVLQDIFNRIERLEKAVAKIGTYSAFKASSLFTDAVERNLMVIGEALYAIKQQRLPLPITDSQKIIALWHIITHEYYNLDYGRIWVVVMKHLALLKTEVAKWLQEEALKHGPTGKPDVE